MEFRVENCAVTSVMADSSAGEFGKALQRNTKHEATLSNISGLFPFGARPQSQEFEMEGLISPRTLSALRCSFASLRMTNE